MLKKFLIVLVYYERPKIVLNALNSILDIKYPNFEVHVVDDGSINKVEPIVREVCSSIIDKFTFHYINNTPEQKREQGGSIHGKYVTDAVKQSDADHVILLCDDDAIYPNFLDNLNLLLNSPENKDKKYFYHNILKYNSLVESYKDGIQKNDLSFYTNQWKEPINCCKHVDSSQVTYDREGFVNENMFYPHPQTSDLDAASFQQMFDKWGPAYYSELIAQIKSDNEDNLAYKVNTDKMYITKDGENKKFKKMSEAKYSQFNDEVFVIDCWPDTKEKENTLIELIKRVKIYGAPIILAGHYPINPEIQKLVDYYIYDGNNDILLEKDFNEYGVNSDRWSDMGNNKITNKIKFHHDYAIWLTMKNTFNLAKQLGKKYIHFLEYDNLPDEIQYRQSFMEYIWNYDAVLYEYSKGSTNEQNPYCATFLFSIRTDIALELVGKINSKEEFFKNKPDRWQLEKVFYKTLKSITNRVYISDYIANEDELNIYAAWNRNGILKNGARLQTYLCVDDFNNLYVHFISGFSEKPADKDYLVEVNYGNYKKFHNVKKGQFHLEKIGPYIKDETVKVYYQGVNIYNEVLDVDVNEFRRMNKLTKKNNPNSNRRVNIHFIDGPFIEIIEDDQSLYNVQFIDKKTNKIEYQLDLKSNHWARSAKKYYVDWLIKITGVDNDYYSEHHLNLENQRVMICFESKSLGDSLAWMGQIEKFRQVNKCKVICSGFQNDLFKDQYPEIEFVNAGSNVNNINALYRLGVFYNDKREIDYSKHKSDPKKEPLMKVASDILGLDYTEEKPRLKKLGKNVKKRVSIAIHGTSQCKYWNNPTGWQNVTNYLKSKGYEVRLLSKEHDNYMGNKHPKGIIQQKEGPITEVIKSLQESELFIGISSGLSWLSWAAGTPTILISGFTDEDLEPTEGVVRLINKDVCNSCWSNYSFDPGDWNWCPVHKGTNRQFECSKTITSEDVIKEINKLLF